MSIESVVIKDSSGEEVYRLSSLGEEALFGRDPMKCAIKFLPTAKGVSRIHAKLSWTEKGIVFHDSSTYGSCLNGRKIVGGCETIPESFSLVIGENSFEIDLRIRKCFAPIVEEESPVSVTPPPPPTPSSELLKENQSETMRMSTILGHSRRRMQKKRKTSETNKSGDDLRPKVKRGPINFEKLVTATPFDIEEPSSSAISAVPMNVEIMEVDQNDETKMEVKQRRNNSLLDVSDRGPSGSNESIIYANLIFNSQIKKSCDNTTIMSNVPNFKRFKPKQFQNGRTSAASFNNTRCSNTSNSVSIELIESKCFK